MVTVFKALELNPYIRYCIRHIYVLASDICIKLTHWWLVNDTTDGRAYIPFWERIACCYLFFSPGTQSPELHAQASSLSTTLTTKVRGWCYQKQQFVPRTQTLTFQVAYIQGMKTSEQIWNIWGRMGKFSSIDSVSTWQNLTQFQVKNSHDTKSRQSAVDVQEQLCMCATNWKENTVTAKQYPWQKRQHWQSL